MERPIYLDYNATTPVDPAVVEAMVPYLFERFGNASSAHVYGYEAHEAMERGRASVASLIGARPSEIVFTGGGSETDNLALQGLVFANLERRPHIVSTTCEHPAVLNTLQYLKRRFGAQFTLLDVDEDGLVAPEQLAPAIRPETILVTIMHANNETGTIQPIAQLARVAREAGVCFHVDAAQSVGKIEVDVNALGVDMLTIAAHKLYGPKGIGALYLREGMSLDPLVHGSQQEHGLRAGTENVASMVGMGTACEIAKAKIGTEGPRLAKLRDKLQALLEERLSGTVLNGHPTQRLPNTLNVSLPEAIGQTVLAYAPGVAASTGSACHAGQTEPSPVLMAMGMSRERALGALRLSLGRWTTREDVEQAAELLADGYTQAATVTAEAGA
jgi:cysteine desulfurase